ncbi:RlmE family RNA methyltransferase [Peredibacter starrii]|uniref:Ribosomal RNA large subunit methyltransferase E n=1 Tax=Peredibacter starrii TaxID=28202 RepID=A0AAX4HQH4_9BACT|nr:RlmE family RNA methyltransferase [Peredibacter starrii]WPU65512.1 RlmE family RNA methyltransferase [Peredibacter starrii]
MSNFKVKDHYFNKAKNENFLARSVYKLEEIDEKYKILKPGMQVVDFGYHPGSWIQYTSRVIGDEGRVVGIDVREVNKKLSGVKNVRVYQKDIFDIHDLSQLEVDGQFDVVLSDMAPNTTGIKTLDQDRSLNLVESVFGLLPRFLKPGGNFVIKVFDSQSAQNYLKEQKNLFKEFHYLKPKSTRSISKEFFVIGKSFKA